MLLAVAALALVPPPLVQPPLLQPTVLQPTMRGLAHFTQVRTSLPLWSCHGCAIRYLLHESQNALLHERHLCRRSVKVKLCAHREQLSCSPFPTPNESRIGRRLLQAWSPARPMLAANMYACCYISVIDTYTINP